MIEIQSLTKTFDGFKAVDNLNLKVGPGEVLGFLGPNGAGKSTTMKMITGFLMPTSGHVQVMGYDVVKHPLQVKKIIGYLPEGAPLWGDMTPKQFLQFVGSVRGLVGNELNQRMANVVDLLSLGSVMEQPIDTLSKGFRRRLGLAQAILHDPQILVLDEPTDGLDPNQKHEVRKLIHGLAKQKIVIISTHILEEVDAVCSRAVVIANGQLVLDGTPKELESRSRYHNAVTIWLEEADAVSRLAQIEGVAQAEADPDQPARVTLFPQEGQSIYHSVHALVESNQWTVRELHVERGRLDDVFRQVTVGG